MKNQVFNPYLPLNTYIPDGEPHVFGDRVYVFGSHDEENGKEFCVLDYECFSAPVNDLTAWRSEGIIYKASQDPTRGITGNYMYAPDVVQGNDGRFYLYYALSGGGHFTGPIHVAVCDTPSGKYEYYGEVRNPDGTTFDRCITFDPGLLNDHGSIYLYYGWAIGMGQRKIPKFLVGPSKFLCKHVIEAKLFEKTKEQIKREPDGIEGGNVVELEEDMLTVIGEPKRIVPGQLDAIGTQWEEHAFFEASSMRKVGDTYYYIYSSNENHELCYATSKHPDRDFKYGGAIVSNGDIGMDGRGWNERLAATGNNHGSIECINNQWYIFYHRQTNKTCYSRQGCAEKIYFEKDGSIRQVEMTSCGLNNGPLIAEGTYPAAICCNLYNDNIRKYGHTPIVKGADEVPAVVCRNNERFVGDINDGTVIGYKYFNFNGKTKFFIKAKAEEKGQFEIAIGTDTVGKIEVNANSSWSVYEIEFDAKGKQALYLNWKGKGKASLIKIGFH